MGIGDKLQKIGTFVRKRWRSTDPDSYDQYRRGRERQQAEQEREGAEHHHGDQEREKAERGREYEERYRAERAAEEPRTEAPRGDRSHPE